MPALCKLSVYDVMNKLKVKAQNTGKNLENLIHILLQPGVFVFLGFKGIGHFNILIVYL